MLVRRQAGAGRGRRHPLGQLAEPHAAAGAVGLDRDAARQWESRRGRRPTAPPSCGGGPARPCGRPRRGSRPRARATGTSGSTECCDAPPPRARRRASAPGRSPRPARRRPAPGARRCRGGCSTSRIRRRRKAGGCMLLGLRQLLAALAEVALAVGLEVRVVHLRRALHQHGARVLDARSRWDPRTAATRGGCAPRRRPSSDSRCPVVTSIAPAPALVVGRDRPGDRLARRVDGRQLRGDEALEDLLHVCRERAVIGASISSSDGRERVTITVVLTDAAVDVIGAGARRAWGRPVARDRQRLLRLDRAVPVRRVHGRPERARGRRVLEGVRVFVDGRHRPVVRGPRGRGRRQRGRRRSPTASPARPSSATASSSTACLAVQ